MQNGLQHGDRMSENKQFTHKKWYNERQLFDGEEAFAIVDTYIQAERICDRLNKLCDENKQIKHTIQEAYETERTQIGKNVLKQLMEAIE